MEDMKSDLYQSFFLIKTLQQLKAHVNVLPKMLKIILGITSALKQKEMKRKEIVLD